MTVGLERDILVEPFRLAAETEIARLGNFLFKIGSRHKECCSIVKSNPFADVVVAR